MKEIKPEHYFYVSDGKVIKSLEELPEALEQMQDGTFSFHANEFKNDFANWVRDVFNKKSLAMSIQKAGSRQGTIAVVKKALIKPSESKNLGNKDPKKHGYFSKLEPKISKRKLPNDMLSEMKKHWD